MTILIPHQMIRRMRRNASDENGWTRSYSKAKKQDFLGPTPRGPKFNLDAMRQVDFVFKFFSLDLLRWLTR